MTERSHPRFPLHVPVTVEWPPKIIEMEAVNISRAGLLMSGAELFPVGSAITIHIPLTRVLDLSGIVRHMVNGCGIEFISLLPEEQAKLNAYLDRLAAQVAEHLRPER